MKTKQTNKKPIKNVQVINALICAFTMIICSLLVHDTENLEILLLLLGVVATLQIVISYILSNRSFTKRNIGE